LHCVYACLVLFGLQAVQVVKGLFRFEVGYASESSHKRAKFEEFAEVFAGSLFASAGDRNYNALNSDWPFYLEVRPVSGYLFHRVGHIRVNHLDQRRGSVFLYNLIHEGV
jgi:hypothetical protein